MGVTPFDPTLVLLAKEAAVRPPHVFHCLAAMRQMGAKFRPAVYAEFSGLELRHVERIMTALEAHGMLPKRAVREGAKGVRLALDWTLPDDWRAFARSERRWDDDAIEAEAAHFADYWRSQPGQKGVKLDWFATWRNWVRNSRRPSGTATLELRADYDAREQMQRTAALYDRMGRTAEAEEIRRQLNPNVIPLLGAVRRAG